MHCFLLCIQTTNVSKQYVRVCVTCHHTVTNKTKKKGMFFVKIFYKIHSKHFKAFNYKTIGKSNIKIAIKKEH